MFESTLTKFLLDDILKCHNLFVFSYGSQVLSFTKKEEEKHALSNCKSWPSQKMPWYLLDTEFESKF